MYTVRKFSFLLHGFMMIQTPLVTINVPRKYMFDTVAQCSKKEYNSIIIEWLDALIC